MNKTFLFSIIVMLFSCKNHSIETAFINTPCEELSHAVESQNVSKINRIVKETPELVNCTDSKYGNTLLMWAVSYRLYNSTEALLKCGADPNIKDICGETALHCAAKFSLTSYNGDIDINPKFIDILVKNGADVNTVSSDCREPTPEFGFTPLMLSITSGFTKVKALVNAGSDINLKTSSGETAAHMALSLSNSTSISEEFKSAYYLIVDKKADITIPSYSDSTLYGKDKNAVLVHYPVVQLRNLIFPIGSEEYKQKLLIIKEFKRQGVDYYQVPIPERKLEQIKHLYPKDWQEYIRKY